MNKILVIAAVAALASSANAAPAKQSAQSRNNMNVAAASTKSASATQQKGSLVGSSTATSATTGAVSKSPATGSNVLTTQQLPKKAEKAWGASFYTEAEVAAGVANNPEITDKSVESLNHVRLTYKVTPATTLGYRHYFTANHTAADLEKNKPAQNTVEMADVAFTVKHKAGKILGSDAITPTLYYYAPTSDASQKISSNGKFRLDGEIDFTLSPKWTVGYFLSGRQTMVPENTTVDAEGKETLNFSKSQLIHFGVLYYNFTDKVQAYTYGGMSHVWRSSTATLNGEGIVGGLGTSFSMFDGLIALNPELTLEQATVKDGADLAVGGPTISEKNLKYYLLASLNF